jgi:hypothetical protein
MPDAQRNRAAADDIRDQVKKGLSEVRTTVLGGQILLGFQYEALFQNGFETLTPLRKLLELAAFALLVCAMVLMIAPAAYHQLSERGQSSQRQRQFTKLMVGMSLAPFALAIGVNIVVATGGELGLAGSVGLAVAAVLGAAFLWYGIEIMAARSSGPRSPKSQADTVAVSLKERVGDLMTETRIVLPGVQALLGFQFAAYLTQAFAKLPADARMAHDISLVLLLTSMVLLMTPAPFHRLAEDGRETERLCRLTVRLIALALAALALAVALDVYVAVMAVMNNSLAASLAAALAATLALAVWFAYPLMARGSSAAVRADQQHRLARGADHA